MNKKIFLMSIPLFAISLNSCASQIDWKTNLNEYVTSMKWHENFNVLQLTDIHWNINSSTISSREYLDKLFEEVNKHVTHVDVNNHVTGGIDLVELTGDQFMLANANHVKTFVSYFEEKAEQYNFKYTVIWGNHDRHGMYSPNWLADQYRGAKHCIYLEPEDNLYGRSNFVINLTPNGNKEETPIWQLFNLDSGASFSESPLAVGRDYDYIREDQVQWYEALQEPTAKAIAYYHIPQQDNLKAWDAIHKDSANLKHKYFKLEDFASSEKEEYDSRFITSGRAHNLKAAFMGHAHNVDWTVELDDGFVLGLGVKTGEELYFAHIDPEGDRYMKEGLTSINASLPEEEKIKEKFDLIGASLVTIKDSNTFDLEHLYYNVREGADFVRWVKF